VEKIKIMGKYLGKNAEKCFDYAKNTLDYAHYIGMD